MKHPTAARIDVEARYRQRTPRSSALHQEALRVLPGGDSRSNTYHPPYPTFMERGKGYTLQDVDGNRYLDFLNNYTALVHGHAHPRLVEQLSARIADGSALGAPAALQVRLAEAITERVPSIEQLRFANSGTEAVLNAVRAARAFTGRPGLLKMEGGYHGSYEPLKVSVDPGLDAPPWPAGKPDGVGVTPALLEDVLVAPFNDLATTAAIIERHHASLAAVIVEPVLGHSGMIPAEPDFLRGLRAVTAAHGVLLILDEVQTFRLAVGGAQAHYGVVPDLTVLGKMLGGGMPFGAFGGRADIMALFDPRQPGYIRHTGTSNANPVSLLAGLLALELFTPEVIAHVNRLGERLRGGFQAVLDALGAPGAVTGLGSLAHVHLASGPVRDYRDAARANRAGWHDVHLGLLNRGIYASPKGTFVVSAPMREAEVDRAVEALREALMEGMPALVTHSAGT
jgi:glutamate-1-semialdehyde 2,1-aminomutase